MARLNSSILQDYGGVDSNDLRNILNAESDYENQSLTIIKASNYHDVNHIINKLSGKLNYFKVISFNAESIASKINEIKVFMELMSTYEVHFDAICINECWLENFGDDLNIQNYTAFSLNSNVGKKGGLITYISKNYTVKEINLYTNSSIWEGQFFEIKGNGLKNKLALGNIYVPPRGRDHFMQFNDIFIPILNNLSINYKQICIAGDTNADALKFNTDSTFSNYFDNLTNCGLLPLITFPTHFGPKNGSIIDHIYIKSNISLSNTYSGISLYKFSNHLPVFTCIPIKNEVSQLPKFINITKNDPSNYQNLRNAMQQIDWRNHLNTNISADPSENYSKFLEKLTSLKNDFLPTKRIRFNRHKHKNNEWITTGLCIS